MHPDEVIRSTESISLGVRGDALIERLPPKGGRLRARLKVAGAPPASGSRSSWDLRVPLVQRAPQFEAANHIGPAKADRLKGGGFKPGTLD